MGIADLYGLMGQTNTPQTTNRAAYSGDLIKSLMAGLGKAFLYNQDTKRAFPQSPIYPIAEAGWDKNKQIGVGQNLAMAAGINSPTKYYHGTNANFTTFDASKAKSNQGIGQGIYFTPDKSRAANYGKNVMEAELNIKNPYILGKTDASKYAEQIIRKYQPKQIGNEYHLEYVKSKLKNQPTSYIEGLANDYKIPQSQIYNEMGFDAIQAGPETLVFSPSQIKMR